MEKITVKSIEEGERLVLEKAREYLGEIPKETTINLTKWMDGDFQVHLLSSIGRVLLTCRSEGKLTIRKNEIVAEYKLEKS